MKYEKLLSCLVGAVLAFTLSFGVVGAMVTAFDLTVGSMGLLLLTCVSLSAISALCFQIKRGSLVLLCGLALLTGFLWRGGRAVEQTMSLLYQISKFYDSAYGWGVFYYGSGVGAVDYPIGILGALVAIAVSWTVCRRQSIWPAAAAVLVPLCACLVVTDTVPEETYLYLILLGFLILVMTNTVRRKSALQGITLTAIVSAPLALALLGAFWLAPQDSYVNQVPDIQQQAIDLAYRIPELWEEITSAANVDIANDQADSVDLDGIGPRPELTYEVMDVFGTVDGVLYLRGQDYDFYNGTGWTSTLRNSENFPGSAESFEAAGAVTIETKRVRDLIYLPYYPTEPADLIGGKVLNSENAKRYVFTRGVLPADWQARSCGPAALTQAQAHAESQAAERYLSLPADTKEWASGLLADILTEGMTRTEQAYAISGYVRNSARYDLNTARMPSENEDFTVWFLEDSDTGYCVHFATATTVLLRAAGIPARYVTGYMTYAEAGKTVTVTAGDAHAWAEYYEPVLDAWIVLESTPADLNQENPLPTDTATEPAASDSPDDNTEATTPSPEATQEPTSAPTKPTDSTGNPDDKPMDAPPDFAWLRTLLGWIVTLAALIGSVPLQRMIRLRLRKRRQESAAPNVLALLLWRDAVLRSRLLERRPPRELEKLAQKAKFSQHTLTEEELAQLHRFVTEAEAALRAKPWYWQILLRYVLAVY